MVKTFKNLLLQNQLTDGLETWYVELGTQVQKMTLGWHWPILRQGQIWKNTNI